MVMTSMSIPIADDNDLDDAALWAIIDSAAADAIASYSSTATTTATAATTITTASQFRKPLKSPNLAIKPSPPAPPPPPRNYTSNRSPRVPIYNRNDEFNRPQKIPKNCNSEKSPNLMVVQRIPTTPIRSSPESGDFPVKELSPYFENDSPKIEYRSCEEGDKFRHCLAGRFPTVSLFKNYQDAAVEVLERSDYTMISGSPFIKKSGWRKIALYFNISFEIKDRNIEFDENRNVQRAEFVVRAHMQGGRFSDGWGSCERREKRFIKPNNDIPTTAETRAKNRACQDLLGIGADKAGKRA